MTLNFTRKHCPVIFFSRNNACTSAGFPEPALATNTRFADSLFGKTKALFGKDAAREKDLFLHTLFVENERETSELK